MTATHANIELRDGVPYVEGTGTRVRGIALNHLNFGWDGRELQEQMPHLTVAQVYAALSYYYDHKDEIDAELEASEREAEVLRPLLENPDSRARLIAAKRARGQLQ